MKRILLGLIVLVTPLFFAYKEDVKTFAITRVVIDAGHGGHDGGCVGSSSKEKEVTLAVALKLGKYIEENFNDVKVIYTRKTDVFVELHERASIANSNKADFFICIHCNSGPKDAIGAETYVMGLHKTEDNLNVAKRENASIMMEENYKTNYEGFDPNSPESYIAFSLYQNAFMSQSLSFASKVQSQFKEKTGRYSRGVKQAGFLVLYKTTMPSVLIETGFLTNSVEEKFLNTAGGQDQIASAIFRAFRDYKLEKEGIVKHSPSISEAGNSKLASNTESSVEKENVIKEVPDGDKLIKEKIEKDRIAKEKAEKERLAKEKSDRDKQIKEAALAKNKEHLTVKPKVETASVSQTQNVSTPITSDTSGSAVIIAKPDVKILYTFSVQIGISSKPLPLNNEFFKGIDKNRIFSENSTDGVKYTVGNLRKLNEAIVIQNEMRAMGFTGAFVIAYKNGKRIPLNEASSQTEK